MGNSTKILFTTDDNFAGFYDAFLFATCCESHFIPMLKEIAEGNMSDQSQKLAGFLSEHLETLVSQINNPYN